MTAWNISFERAIESLIFFQVLLWHLHEFNEILYKIISPGLICNQMLDEMISVIFPGAILRL